MKHIRYVLVSCLALFLVGFIHGAVYNVGPAAGQIPQLAGVPWGALQPGDFVNIHAKPGGYREIIQVSASGTAAQPITIRGIPDPVTGALPVIDGTGAVMDPQVDFRNPVFEPFGLIIVTPRRSGYVYGQTFPEWINIESLAIRNAMYRADASITFTDQRGATRLYDAFACGIYIEFARNIAIRGCEISHNGNGIFANSKNGAAQSTVNILIEQNHLHSNGQPIISGHSNGYAHHNIYVEAVGAVYQYNRFGPLRPGCFGCMIKDRSSGLVIRYNEVVSTDASAIFAINDPQGGSGYIETMPDYPDAFVYGNIITLQNTPVHGGINVVWFGAYNGAKFYPALHRGTLHFFHNTIVNHQTGVTAFSLTTPEYTGSSPVLERVDARNNVFFTDTAINTSVWNAFCLVATPASPVIDLGMNWVSPGTRQSSASHPSGAIINGLNHLIIGDALGRNLPGFANLNNLDYHLTSAADSIDAAGPLAAPALAQGHSVTQEYAIHQHGSPRALLGARADLGAFETAALYAPPAPNRVPLVLPQSLNLVGSTPTAIKLLAYDPDGDPLSYSYTTAGLVGSLTGAAPNLTYTPPAASGSFFIGYRASDGQANSDAGFVFVSFNLPGNPPPTVTLTGPASDTAVAKSAPVTLTAAASDANGVKKVELYVGYKLVGTAVAAPYTLNWSSATAGRFQVTAKAFDQLNACAFSQPIFVTVQ